METIKKEIHESHEESFIYIVDKNSYDVLYTNRISKQDLALEEHKHCYEMILGLSEPCEKCPLKLMGLHHQSTWLIKRTEPERKWLKVDFNDIEMQEGEYACVLTSSDITYVQEAAHILEKVLDSVNAAAYTINIENHQLQFLNKKVRDMLPDIKPGDTCYKEIWGFDSVCSFCPISHGEENISAHMERYNEKLGKHLSIDVVDVKGLEQEHQAIFTAYDITRLVETEKSLKQVAYVDPLINIGNRNAFMEDLTEAFKKDQHGFIAIFNIKFLKRYNLLYGRKKGDRLIKRAAAIFSERYVKERIYRVDGAKLGFLAIGGEESELLRGIIDDTIKETDEFWEDSDFPLSFDAVFVAFPEFADSPEQAVYDAEYLLRKNRNLVHSEVLEFDTYQREMLNRREYIEEVLRAGHFEDRFQVYYQPIYNIQENQYSKCEALLRMYDEKIGWVSPVEFIPIAEESGYIGNLGKFVLEEVCRFQAGRIRQGLSPILVNINISPVEFARTSFYDDVVRTVRKWKVPPGMLQLEITEGVLINSMERVIDIMKRMTELGFTFAVDDFGTGYSSLSYIGIMPVECLKLDKSFMDLLLQSETHKLVVTNVIKIAHDLSLSIVAEGIESEEQYNLIRQLGSNYIQGYYFSKPLPSEDFGKFLKAREAEGC